MINKIEVWDGGTWALLWDSSSETGGVITDAVWGKKTFSIGTLKNANMQVRWTYSNGDTAKGGWSIDDVRIDTENCQ